MNKQDIINRLYPIGSCYITFSKDDNPSSRLGGLWELIPENYIVKIANEEINNNAGDEYISSDSNNNYTEYDGSSSGCAPRHSHDIRCIYSGYSGSGVEIAENPDWSNPSAYNLLALDYWRVGGDHTHEMPHTHTYDPSHIKVYLWKRVEL